MLFIFECYLVGTNLRQFGTLLLCGVSIRLYTGCIHGNETTENDKTIELLETLSPFSCLLATHNKHKYGNRIRLLFFVAVSFLLFCIAFLCVWLFPVKHESEEKCGEGSHRV